jgi:hypothetical protein
MTKCCGACLHYNADDYARPCKRHFEQDKPVFPKCFESKLDALIYQSSGLGC